MGHAKNKAFDLARDTIYLGDKNKFKCLPSSEMSCMCFDEYNSLTQHIHVVGIGIVLFNR
jgi:hypothetical protein